VRVFDELLRDRERVLGPDHPATLRTRSNTVTCANSRSIPSRAL
jgi:hypothetical protein